jgi:hypothetical protein
MLSGLSYIQKLENSQPSLSASKIGPFPQLFLPLSSRAGSPELLPQPWQVPELPLGSLGQCILAMWFGVPPDLALAPSQVKQDLNLGHVQRFIAMTTKSSL